MTQRYPFGTSNSANGCTLQSAIASNDEFIVVDTVGFGDPAFNATSMLEEFRRGLRMVDYKVDLILFTLEKGRFDDRSTQLFDLFHSDLFRHKIADNSVLVCNKCEKGWLERNRKTNKNLNRLLNKCHNRNFELNLSYNRNGAAEEAHKLDTINERSLNASIHELHRYLHSIKISRPLDLSLHNVFF